jgi:hypothetical protein
MNDDQLLDQVKKRALDEATRTDFADILLPNVEPCMTEEDVDQLEAVLGFELHPVHRCLYTGIGNGGYGPGYGIIGGPGGYLHEDGASVVEVRKNLWVGKREGLPARILPLCDWGDAIWSCIGSRTGKILTLDHIGLTVSDYDIRTWLADWANGLRVFEKLFEFEEVEVVNPFTKKPTTTSVPSRPQGMRTSRYSSL